METEVRTELLKLLDAERQTVVYPGVTRFSEMGIVKDISTDGKNCEIVYSHCSADDLDRLITQEIEAVRSAKYELEWKVYEHDQPLDLGERLAAAGFEVGPNERFMVFFASEQPLDRFGVRSADIRRVTNRQGLADVQVIFEDVHGGSADALIEQYAFMLENHPDNMSVYVAYVDGEPASCGRIYFHEQSKFAALYGGQTRPRFRQRGLFTQIVAVRIHEAFNRGIINVCVDSLPTSEPILRKRGFEILTNVRAFTFSGPATL